MHRKFLALLAIPVVILLLVGLGFSEEKAQGSSASQATQGSAQEKASEKEKIVVKGTVEKIAEDATSIVVNGTTLLTTRELVEDVYLEVGDKVEVTAEKTDQGLKAQDISFFFEEDAGASEPVASTPPKAPEGSQTAQ